MVVWCTKHQRGPKATREYPKHTPQDVSPLVFSRLMTHLPRADLDPIFLGYASQRKSYRLQDCESGRTFECRSVKFVEDGAADENPNKSVQVDHSYTQPPGPQVVDDPEDADDIDDQPEQSPPRHKSHLLTTSLYEILLQKIQPKLSHHIRKIQLRLMTKKEA
ncbi:hypothetical protein Ae201684P_013692 [Aphanomyces euteiches]|nr:hypothetical protein Ae201684P_013692 [Aphanomyces euteiches]